MSDLIYYDHNLTVADSIVLKNLALDVERSAPRDPSLGLDHENSGESDDASEASDHSIQSRRSCSTGISSVDSSSSLENLKTKREGSQPWTGGDSLAVPILGRHRMKRDGGDGDVERLRAMNDATRPEFRDTVFFTVDDLALHFPASINEHVLQPFTRWAKTVIRHETDVVMLTHLLLYFTTLVPSAVMLFKHFSYIHGVLHLAMQFYYVGSYTLMMHQHIHQRGILNKKLGLFDKAFPYLLDPMMGHTWNTYFYHHVKHHHVEGNGPNDLSSTIRYQRDSVIDFLKYVGRFFFLIWLDLPLYFLNKKRPAMAVRAAGSEFSTYVFYFVMAKCFSVKATVFVYLIPLLLLRIGLMVGNWGQHAFVDPDEPGSDYKSSITLIDVASNRFCFNDGYHTSHHLNPLRHWRDHPVSFLEQKHTYAREGALVFHNIDFLMVTVRLLLKDYQTLAKCLVPMGDQIDLTMEGRIALLKKLVQKFTEEQIEQKFPGGS